MTPRLKRIIRRALAGISLFALASCSAAQTTAVNTQLAGFAAKAAPVVQGACTTLASAEANPLVQVALGVGNAAASAATGGVAGPVLASLKTFGDSFCANGPPAGDTSTPAAQASWLLGIVSGLNATITGAVVPAATPPAP